MGIEEVFIPKGSIPFVELGWKLRKRIKFIPDHDRWASIFRRTLISISDEDFQILQFVKQQDHFTINKLSYKHPQFWSLIIHKYILGYPFSKKTNLIGHKF